ncbi:MAG: NTP transferase domain-containing protein [Syntrophomonadaceae bacterium]|nr:NTP transferase domain-containing protein [Syntrophomonadaceae bacterium]
MRRDKISALILAAGYSSRMGEFKPLLPLYGKTVIERAVCGFRQMGLKDIRVVTGYRAEELLPVLCSLQVTPVYNEQYASGMFSSLLAGLRTLADEAEAFFMLPVDTPLVKNKTLEKLLEKFQGTGKSVIYPCFRGERGHPPLIARECFNSILACDISGNLRQVLKQFEEESYDAEVVDRGILLDMDTPEDYENIKACHERGNIPTLEECEALFSLYHVPEPVIRHGRMVAKVAYELGESLNKSASCLLDLDLVMAGGLLHDIAKGRPNHAQAGAAILEQEGFPGVAKVISRHMNLGSPDKYPVIDETALVYLADKVVEKEKTVRIEQRYSDAFRRNTGNPEAVKGVGERMKQAHLIKERIENSLGLNDLYAYLFSGEG